MHSTAETFCIGGGGLIMPNLTHSARYAAINALTDGPGRLPAVHMIVPNVLQRLVKAVTTSDTS